MGDEVLHFKITVFSFQCNTHNSTHCKFFIMYQRRFLEQTEIGMFFRYMSLSVKFSVDFKAEVQEHLLQPLRSLHQIQVDGALSRISPQTFMSPPLLKAFSGNYTSTDMIKYVLGRGCLTIVTVVTVWNLKPLFVMEATWTSVEISMIRQPSTIIMDLMKRS